MLYCFSECFEKLIVSERNEYTNRFLGFTAMALGAGGNLLLLLVTPFCLPQAFGTDRNWWLLPAFCLLLAAIHLFVAGFFPESPKHLYIIQRHCITARRAIRFYHGPDTNAGRVCIYTSGVKMFDFYTFRFCFRDF